jgi:GT2 family glycosyltransferase/ubiquinone/menaquinone biosynthesis C-methylase UbiE
MLQMASDESGALPRRKGAPRLIDWTGERCVPWAPDVQVVYEHLHRYLWAAEVVAGRRVLDLATGEGFGAAILARSAASVVGVDIDERTVEHAKLNYEADNLSFELADARTLTQFEDGSFGAVVAFEIIEHVSEQDSVLDEIRRVLEPGGVLIVSTPDREAYAKTNPGNPFHARELLSEEFVELLRSRFANVATFAQRAISGSALEQLEHGSERLAAAGRSFVVERAGDEWRVAPGLPALYVVAVASDGELPPLPRDSTLADPELELKREAATAAREQLKRELERLKARSVQDAATIASLNESLNDANRKLSQIEGSVTWQLFQRVRATTFKLLGGRDSPGGERLQAALRLVGRLLLRGRVHSQLSGAPRRVRRVTRGTGPLSFPPVSEPDVSIVIPLYAHAELTDAALRSILDNTNDVSYEVILVDDSEDPPTKALLERVSGAKVIVNASNLGYLRSTKRGADAAAGRWLVLCNNDIEVEPGWLGELLDCGESDPSIAVVVPKYVYPDGSLAEAGGIVFRDGTGANYGRGEDPARCHYEYRREVDYGSAAALMVRTDFWREVGGFDERFEPMYYEDTDLCFEARRRGLRVMYEPRSEVIHVEGATAGTDENSGHKRHQARNRPKFVEKWGAELQAGHVEADRALLWMAANLRRGPRVLVVDHRVPTWDRDSGSLRMRGMLEALHDLGCQVTFLPVNALAAQPYTSELQRIGIEVLYGIDLRAALRRIGPGLSLAILSRPQFAKEWLKQVHQYAPQAPVVFDTVDLHWLREARRAALTAGNGAGLSRGVSAMRERELGLVRATDATLVVTEEERAHVISDVPEALVQVVPNVHEPRQSVPGPEGRRGVLFVGGFEHPPNVHGALVLVREVMPIVWRELGDVPVTIVGADAPAEVEQLASELVHVRGWVPDLDPVLDSARMLLAPLTYGAGLKGKVTQALAVGLPVLTTPIGAEGLDAVDGEHMLIGDSPAGMAQRAVRLLCDDALWRRLSNAGQELVAAHCSPAVMSARLGELLEQLSVGVAGPHAVGVR